jgi:hypothetical protein
MEILVFVIALLVLDFAALKWGFDSRDGFIIRRRPAISTDD